MVLLAILLGMVFPANATHYRGSEITYECMGGTTYRVWMTGYNDCAGVIGFGLPMTVFGDSSSCAQPTPLTGWVPVDTTNITIVCPGALTDCEMPGQMIGGVRQYRWYRDYDFGNVDCDHYGIQFSSCCRNASALNVIPPGGAGMFNSSYGIDLASPSCNSSPVFVTTQRVYMLDGTYNIMTVAATDPDGDSLAYALGPCLEGQNGDTITYAAGHDPVTAPFGPGWNIQLDAVTGDLSFQPTPGALTTGVICVYVKEYRNGVQIGQIVKDMHVYMMTNVGGLTTNPVINLENPVNATVSGMEVYGCTGSNMCFDLHVTEPDTNLQHEIWWLTQIAGATFTDAQNPGVTDTVAGQQPSARFCWTPTQPGTYVFHVRAKNDQCLAVGRVSHSIRIHISDPAAVAPTLTLSGDTLSVQPAGATYQWYVDSMSIPGATSQHHVAQQSGQYYALLTDSSGCSYWSDTLAVTLLSRTVPTSTTLRAWPNPSTGLVEVDGLEIGGDISLLDVSGRMVAQFHVTDTHMRIDWQDLPAGVYFLRSGNNVLRLLLQD
jgi:hypothetical protein